MIRQNYLISESTSKNPQSGSSQKFKYSKQPVRKRMSDRMFSRLSTSKFNRIERSAQKQHSTQVKSCYQKSLQKSLFGDDSDTISVRSFAIIESQRKDALKTPKRNSFNRPSTIKPYKQIKVNGWKDNYYSNLLDWSYNNFLIYGSGSNKVTLQNTLINDDRGNYPKKTFQWKKIQDVNITSIKSSPNEAKFALGYSSGDFKVFDYLKEKEVFQCKNLHLERIATISWSSNLITGSRDKQIKFIDLRADEKQNKQNGIHPTSHWQQVCGLQQNDSLLASGGNDNMVYIFDLRKCQVLDNYQHNAAVKALTWIKGSKNLVSGGGTADKKLKFWKDSQGVYKEVDTGSQVCSLLSSITTQQIISCQGFSLNQIVIWNYQGQRVHTLYGHKSRVLYSCLNPQGDSFASGAGDKSLKIWKVFPKNDKQDQLFNFDIR